MIRVPVNRDDNPVLYDALLRMRKKCIEDARRSAEAGARSRATIQAEIDAAAAVKAEKRREVFAEFCAERRAEKEDRRARLAAIRQTDQPPLATHAGATTNTGGPAPSMKESPMSKKTTTKTAKAPRAKTPDNRVVFAFRLTTAERDQIHKAAGAGKASQFVLEAALAAAKRA